MNSRPVHTYETIDQWIAGESIPFSVDSSHTSNAAIDKVIASLSDSLELLGFGEALHGGQEILELRNRLFTRLAEAHGFSAIAIESSFPRAHITNKFVTNEFMAGRGPTSYEDVKATGFGEGVGALEANRELVEWMRVYNADPAHPVKLRFYGFDLPTGTIGIASPRQTLYFVLDYLALSDSGSKERRKRIEELLGEDSDWENPAAHMDPAKSIGGSQAAIALRIETEDLISELQARRPEWVEKTGRESFMEALQHGKVARGLLNFHASMARSAGYAERLNIRDRLQADNLAYVVARERGRGKVLAFAHNSHLKRGKAEWPLGAETVTWWTAGSQLNEMFGERYAVIGTGIGVSDENGIREPEAGTLEARLIATSGPIRFIPTHKGEGMPASEIARLPVRTGSQKNPTYFPLTPQSFADFDCWRSLIQLSTTATGRQCRNGRDSPK
ncbi:MAG TPA: erythromycin esterase family protein [Anaerolineales bacterium]|nr:erythromycin esterase family protein [Anaerolineales bacterium]